MQALQEAVNQGFDNRQHATTDNDLKSLRDRQDFKALIARMEQAEGARKLAGDAEKTAAPAEKLKIAEQARAIREKLAAAEPANLRHQVDLGYSLHSIGIVQRDAARLREGGAVALSGTRLREKIVKQAPKTIEYRASLGETHIELGKLQWLTGRHKEAEASWDKGVKLCEACIKEEPQKEEAKELLSRKLIEIGDEYAKLILWEEATAFYTRAFALHEPNDVRRWVEYACLLVTNRHHDAYRGLCKRAVECLSNGGKSPPGTLDHSALALLYSYGPDSGVDRKEAVRAAEMGLATSPNSGWRNWYSSMAHSRAGDFEKAIQRARQAMPLDATPQAMLTLAFAYHGLNNRDGRLLACDREAGIRQRTHTRLRRTLPNAISGPRANTLARFE